MVHASEGRVWETVLTNKEMHIRCRGENEPLTGYAEVGKAVLPREADGLLPESQRWKGEMRLREGESVQGTSSSANGGGKGRCASARFKAGNAPIVRQIMVERTNACRRGRDGAIHQRPER